MASQHSDGRSEPDTGSRRDPTRGPEGPASLAGKGGRPTAEAPELIQSAIAKPVQEGPRATFASVKPPSLSLPQGGGAMKSIGETFKANPATGTVSASIPLPLTPAPRGPTPQLGLSYDSGSGNGVFGHGWSVGVPQVVRRTDQKLPEYLDSEDSDEFLFGGEALVPYFHEGTRVTSTEGDFFVERFRPRTEGAFTIIERLTNTTTKEVHWRAHGADNSRSRFGFTTESRIAHPTYAKRVYAWLLDEMRDDRGHVVAYRYEAEDLVNAPAGRPSETSRKNGKAPISNRHLKRVLYGNAAMGVADEYAFELVFDYGEHDEDEPAADDDDSWHGRLDPFSSHRPGFDMRTYRLCKRVLMFHHFSELGDHHLVRSLNLTYAENTKLTQLVAAKIVGYAWDSVEEEYTTEELPSVTLSYTPATFNRLVTTIDREENYDFDPSLVNKTAQWVDLDGEGLPGLLTQRRNALHYKRNVGGGHLGPGAVLDSAPAMQAGGHQLMDVTGSGTMAMVRLDPGKAGYHERTFEGRGESGKPKSGWGPFRTFASNPNVDFNAPNIRLLDLNGDGFDDILVTQGDHFVWYPSLAKDGWGAPKRIAVPREKEDGPAVIFAGRYGSVFLADMSGDGLTDIVRVTHSQVSYWPNLGHGRFGAEIIMDNSPKIDRADWFHPSRIRLADLDGSGTADLIYFDAQGMHVWLNQAGNGYSTTKHLNECVPTVAALRSLSFVDLHGVGMSTAVWHPQRPGQEGKLCHTSPFGTQKPYLLKTMQNGMGLEVTFTYAASTKFYLADKRAGRPWATRLPFPVQVLEEVESFDAVSRIRLKTKYRYHHGHYDTAEREFRGFGMVESEDAEAVAPGLGQGEFPPMPPDANGELPQDPVLTKTWFHTGAWLGAKQDLQAAFAEERWSGDVGLVPIQCVLPTELSAAELREAHRALKGTMLRQEVYGLDGSELEDTPYVVTETSYEVKPLQGQKAAQGLGRPKLHAVFQLLPRESREYVYDRDPSDPRVTQWAALEYDEDFGFVTRDISVAYARRETPLDDAEEEPALAGLGEDPLDEQNRVYAIVTETTIVHALPGELGYRLAIPTQSKTYEFTGLSGFAPIAVATLKSNVSGASEVPYEGPLLGGFEKRLVEHVRVRYYDTENLPDALDFEQVNALALPYESYRLDLTDDLLVHLDLDARITDTLLTTEGGYVEIGEGLYWIPSGRTTFDDEKFYIPKLLKDTFENETEITYDSYSFLVTAVEDELGNTVSAAHDYRVLAPSLVTDPNENRVAAKFDELGRVIAVALMGKSGGSDGDSLADPTQEFEYVTSRWASLQKPNYVHTKARREHGGTASWQESYVYSDGAGRVAMTKVQAEPGDAPELDGEGNVVMDGDTVSELPADPRWVGTGRTIVNNKGNPIKQYEAFFSRTHDWETDENLVNWGVTPVIHYDAIGRPVRVDLPNGTFRRTEYSVWKTTSFDENDTVPGVEFDEVLVTGHLWRDRNHPSDDPPTAEQRARELAELHADTPSRVYVDPLGRAFLAIAHNIDEEEEDQFLATRTVLDIEGAPLSVKDPLGRVCQTYAWSMGGQLLIEMNIDTGSRWTCATSVGEPLRRWDERLQRFRTKYDELRRQTHLFLKVDTDDEVLLERRYYGDDSNVTDPEDENLKGKAIAVYDGAGLVTLGPYDFKGNLLESSRRLALDWTTTPDWIDIETENDVAAAETTAGPLLETETFTELREYDALNRITSATAPDDSEFIPTYNEASLLESVEVKIRGAGTATTFVRNIDYDAKGQRLRIEYSEVSSAAAFVTDYEYDPLTFRLKRLRTTRVDDDAVLQDLNYTFDPVGNVLRVVDGAQQSLFFDDEFDGAASEYRYDAVYRLIWANGREHKSNGDVQVDNNDQPIRNLPLPTDLTAVREYVETYLYDEVGNILEMFHDAGTGAATWTREYTYETSPSNNRLLSTTAPGGSVSYTHDLHGNMATMPHLAAITYTPFDQMMSADLGGGGDAFYIYDTSGTRVRKVIDTGANLIKERIYLGSYELYRETVPSTSTRTFERETLHVMDGAKRIAMVETKTIESGSPIGTPVSRIRFQLGNHLGSAMLECDEDGLIISFEEYHPYGTSAYRSAASGVEVSARRYRYNGKERDDETGLYYYGARYYAAWLGRWTAADPLGIGADGPGLYNYTRGSPVTLVDPSGTSSEDVSEYEGGEQGSHGGPDNADKIKEDEEQLIQREVDRERALEVEKGIVEGSIKYLEEQAGESIFKQVPLDDGEHGGYGYELDAELLKSLGADEAYIKWFGGLLHKHNLIPEAHDPKPRVWVGQYEHEDEAGGYGTKEEAEATIAQGQEDRFQERVDLYWGLLSGGRRGGRRGSARPRRGARGAQPQRGGYSLRYAGGKQSHVNGAIAEQRGFRHATEKEGHFAIQAPGPTTERGKADYITYDPVRKQIVLWDAKYRKPKGRYPTSVSADKQKRWTKAAEAAINDLPEGPLRTQALEALQAGNVRTEIFTWPNPAWHHR